MKIFLIITATILAAIIGLTLVCVGFLFNDAAKRRMRRALIFLDVMILGALIVGSTFRAEIPSSAVEIFGDVATVVFMSQLICVALVLIVLLVRAIYRRLNKPVPFNRERRAMIAYGFFYPIVSTAAALYGNQIERNSTVDNFFDIPIENLPNDLDGFVIAQISDVHLGAYFSLDRLDQLLARIADAKPDLLAITGDIFDNVPMNAAAIKLVDGYCDRFKHGIWYCHGNHEHHRGIRAIEDGLKSTKIHWLVNRAENVGNGLYIVGVDYPMHGMMMPTAEREERAAMEKNFQRQKHEYLDAAMKDVPRGAVCVLLAHHPEFIDDAIEYNIPLTLTGHTHGSQIGIFGLPLFPIFKYTRGMIEHDGKFFGYVHVGNGSWFPLRIGCPPEIAYFTLKQI